MNDFEIQQVQNIIINLEEKNWFIPFYSDLENNKTFWPIFKSAPTEQKEQIKKIIDNYIKEKLSWFIKTKWWQLFKRFFEAYNDLFWKFRKLNENPEQNMDEFQKIGKQVEHEMFKLEWILTERMLNQEKWLDKVVSSFYNIVYNFFPKYNQID